MKADSTGVQGAADVVTLVVDRHARHGRLDVEFDSVGTAAAGPLAELSESTSRPANAPGATLCHDPDLPRRARCRTLRTGDLHTPVTRPFLGVWCP